MRPRVWGTELRGSLAREHGWGRRLPFRAEENELDQSRHLHLRRRLRALGYIGRNGARRCNRHGGGNRSKDRGSRGAEKAGAGARGPEVAIRHRHRKLDAEGLRGGRGFLGCAGGGASGDCAGGGASVASTAQIPTATAIRAGQIPKISALTPNI